jgi:hypothetical protein
MTFGYIYKISFPNGKHYIGLTQTSIKQRTEEHIYSAKSGDTRYLYNALRKYDIVDILELIVIDTADTLEELYEKEIRYIKDYNSYYMNKNGYNMTYGGEGANGYIHTEEDNKKNSERQINYHKNNPDAGKEHSKKLKLYYKENPEIRQQMSEKAKKHWVNTEAREKQSKILKKHHEEHPETRERMSEISTERWKNQEAKVKMIETLKNSLSTPDAKKKCSEAQKKRFENPDERRKNSERRKLHFDENPDAREKILDGRGKNKPFDVCTLDGTFIKTFTYQLEAREYLQKEHSITSTIKIGEVLEGRRKSSAGFVFKYK